MRGEIKANGTAMSFACCARLEGLSHAGARGGAPEGKGNGNYRHGARTRETAELWKLIKSLR